MDTAILHDFSLQFRPEELVFCGATISRGSCNLGESVALEDSHPSFSPRSFGWYGMYVKLLIPIPSSQYFWLEYLNHHTALCLLLPPFGRHAKQPFKMCPNCKMRACWILVHVYPHFSTHLFLSVICHAALLRLTRRDRKGKPENYFVLLWQRVANASSALRDI